MQAQYPAEGKKAEEGRQYPAPPTRSKAGGLGITEKSVDFLLDHNAPSLSLRSSIVNRHVHHFSFTSKPAVRLTSRQGRNCFNRDFCASHADRNGTARVSQSQIHNGSLAGAL